MPTQIIEQHMNEMKYEWLSQVSAAVHTNQRIEKLNCKIGHLSLRSKTSYPEQLSLIHYFLVCTASQQHQANEMPSFH